MQSLYLDAMSEIDSVRDEYLQFRLLSEKIESELETVIGRLENKLSEEQTRNLRQSELLEKKISDLTGHIQALQRRLNETQAESEKAHQQYQNVSIECRGLQIANDQLHFFMKDLTAAWTQRSSNRLAGCTSHPKSHDQDQAESNFDHLIKIDNVTSSRAEIDEFKKEINSIYQELGLHHMLIPR